MRDGAASTDRAAQYDETGGPSVVSVVEVDEPVAGTGQAVVRVHAAGLNPVDSKMRSGFIPSGPPFPRRVGSDVAGVVESVLDGAVYFDGTPVAVGDEVMGRADGSVADRVAASVSELALRPDGLSVEQAGGLWIAGLTANSLMETVAVGAGDVLLVGGAGGAVGFVAAQLAATAGARVIGTASERDHERLREVGVEPVAYGDGLADRVAALGGTLTAVWDCHGRDALDAGVALGVPGDRMAAIAAYAALDELGVRNVERATRTAENLRALGERIAAGEIAFPIAATYPLDEVVAAFEALESSHAPGKIVVTP